VARVSGELATASAVVDRMGMPILAAFLADRGDKLQDVAVDVILRLGAMRALAQGLAASGAKLGEMGTNEAAEGMIRLAAAGKAAEASDALSRAGAELSVRGAEELVVASAARDIAKDALIEGVGDVASGAYDLGEASAVDATAQAIKPR
jgi:hypothetical protein